MIVAQIKGMYSVNICPCADRKSHACLNVKLASQEFISCAIFMTVPDIMHLYK